MIQQNLNSCMIHNYNIVACRQQVDSNLAVLLIPGVAILEVFVCIVAAAYRRLVELLALDTSKT